MEGLISRAITLFSVGAALALALNLVQVWTWLVVPLLAIAATAVGLTYPYVCEIGSEDVPDISKVMRCVAVFVGIYTAITKIEFSSFTELIITMGALAVGMWWLFDRSKGGLLLSFVFTTISTLASHAIIYFTDLKVIDAGFWYSRLWCLYFSGCITFGAIGRRLAADD